MAVAMKVISQAGTLTEAACEAGFSSPSHVSTAFLEMFGLSPSSLLELGVHISVDTAL